MYIVCYFRDVVGRCGDSKIQDATALTEVDSGLQMAMSPCSGLSALSVTSAASKDPQRSGSVAITTTGVSAHSGMWH